jgi:hypothetical protein
MTERHRARVIGPNTHQICVPVVLSLAMRWPGTRRASWLTVAAKEGMTEMLMRAVRKDVDNEPGGGRPRTCVAAVGSHAPAIMSAFRTTLAFQADMLRGSVARIMGPPKMAHAANSVSDSVSLHAGGLNAGTADPVKGQQGCNWGLDSTHRCVLVRRECSTTFP